MPEAEIINYIITFLCILSCPITSSRQYLSIYTWFKHLTQKLEITLMPDKEQVAEFLEFANSIADQARVIALNHYQRLQEIREKEDSTYVTEADIEIENTARSMVEKSYQDHGFSGEELGNHGMHNDWIWSIDPIDGTTAFVHGIPTFGILISLMYKKVPVVGIIDAPALGERWSGALHHQTTLQGEPCTTNQHQALENSIVFATSIDMFPEPELRVFNAVTKRAKRRRFGIDCYAYGLLASGKIDVVMEATMKAHDTMALVPVVISAGGVITDWNGDSITHDFKGRVLATANSKLHEDCLRIIEKNFFQV